MAVLGLILLPGEEEEGQESPDIPYDDISLQPVQNGGNQLTAGGAEDQCCESGGVEEGGGVVDEVDGPPAIIWNGEEWLRQAKHNSLLYNTTFCIKKLVLSLSAILQPEYCWTT